MLGAPCLPLARGGDQGGGAGHRLGLGPSVPSAQFAVIWSPVALGMSSPTFSGDGPRGRPWGRGRRGTDFSPGGRTSARGRPPPWGRTWAAGVGCTWVQVTEESCTLASSRKLKRATTVQYGPGAMGGEEPTRPFDLRPLCVPLLKSAQQTLVDQTFAFPSHVTCLLPLLSPRPQPSSSLAEDG